MENNFKSLRSISSCFCFFLFIFLLSCSSSDNKGSKSAKGQSSTDEYFSAKINGKLWEAFPSKEFKQYNLSYKQLSKQFSIFAEADDGSRMDLSFHAVDQIKPGNYPSTNNDNGILSGVFYYPKATSSDLETASVTMDIPIQENAVQITKVDKSNPSAYIIEGTFSPTMYASYQTNPNRTSKLTDGKFRVIYHPDSMHPSF